MAQCSEVIKDWIHDQQCRGGEGGKGDTPRLCCSYRDYQVIMHAFIYLFNTSLRGVHIIIYILGFIMLAINETPKSTHMGDTPESFRPHTNFGMAVGSMQTWNLSWLFTNIEYFFIRYYYWNIWDNPSTILPQGLQGPGGSLTLRHWRYCGGSPAATITWQLLYYCQKKRILWAFIKQSELCCWELLF